MSDVELASFDWEAFRKRLQAIAEELEYWRKLFRPKHYLAIKQEEVYWESVLRNRTELLRFFGEHEELRAALDWTADAETWAKILEECVAKMNRHTLTEMDAARSHDAMIKLLTEASEYLKLIQSPPTEQP